MPEKPGMHLYEYAVVRYMPRVEREEFVNVGLAMMCKRGRWIRVEMAFCEAKAKALCPEADMATVREQLEAFGRIAAGKAPHTDGLEVHERFRWLTAVRSACITTSRPHPGICSDLDATFDRLFAELVE
ncbi:MAG: DUF3037 domain-containing protein [Muribaculaceae bacterium]|nr:DUF3037 domain-containing protein [Muribaculaceae bacterium]